MQERAESSDGSGKEQTHTVKATTKSEPKQQPSREADSAVTQLLLLFDYFTDSATTSTQQQICVAVEAAAAATTAKMPYRTDLKRPDLKGQFPCNVCGKVFCHSSSLSRHRMQAHFKSYTCTQCNQEIASSDTLRSHMYRYHQIQRMFMCRCCNWAFPDKTSLHIHMQSMQKSGMPGDVSVLARSYIDKGEISPSGGHQQDNSSHPSAWSSPSYNSNPDEEEHRRQGQSSSPSLSEMEEKDCPYQQIDVGMDNSPPHIRHPSLESSGIFPQNAANTHQQYHSNDRRITSDHPTIKLEMNTMNTSMGMGGEEEKRGWISGVVPPSGVENSSVPASPQMSSVPSSAPFPASSQPAATSIFQQQWFTQWLANNPFFATSLESYLNNGPAGGSIKGLLTQNQQPNSQMAMLQALIAAATSTSPVGNCSSLANAPPTGNNGIKMPTQQHQPPPKKARTALAGKGTSAAALQLRQQKGTKSGGGDTTTGNDLSVHIPTNQQLSIGTFHSPFSSNGSANSPASNDGSKMCALIDSLLHIKRSSGQNSPMDEACKPNDGGAQGELERRNKRKTRVPTRAMEMAEMVYGDDLEVFCEKAEKRELAQAASHNVFPSIQRLMMAQSSTETSGNSVVVPSCTSSDPQQPSPAVSDSQTSGSSSNGAMGGTAVMESALNSPSANNSTKCRSTESDQHRTATADKSNANILDDNYTRGKAERIRQIVDRITTVAEEVAKSKVREELIECARQLQLVAASDE
uniref:C2H2-type domain-containing protein n=1 Tax=Globodera rostochiensis TaxID=31243 RepID=A0A914H1B5_GLORO